MAKNSGPVELYAPSGYITATAAVRDSVCNGCGTAGLGDFLVPDTIWGLSVREACRIHDWMYVFGETIADKDEADRVFLNNMLRLIQARNSCRLLTGLRRVRARTYYRAVRMFGGPAFWRGKNSPANLWLWEQA